MCCSEEISYESIKVLNLKWVDELCYRAEKKVITANRRKTCVTCQTRDWGKHAVKVSAGNV